MLAMIFFHQTFLYFSFVVLKPGQVTRFVNVPLHKHPEQYCAKGDLQKTENELCENCSYLSRQRAQTCQYCLLLSIQLEYLWFDYNTKELWLKAFFEDQEKYIYCEKLHSFYTHPPAVIFTTRNQRCRKAQQVCMAYSKQSILHGLFKSLSLLWHTSIF